MAHAQAAPEPRLYVGLQAVYMRYPLLRGPAVYPLAASLGVWVDQNSGVELGYTGRFANIEVVDYGTSTTYYKQSTQFLTLSARTRLHSLASPSRWIPEMSAGIVGLRADQSTTTYDKGSTLSPTPPYRRTSYDLQVAAGIGGRYHLGAHWQLTGEAQGQLSFAGLMASAFTGRLRQAVGGGLLIGTRYTF